MRRSLIGTLIVATLTIASPQARAVAAPEVTYRVAGGVQLKLDAYLPQDAQVHPGVVLIHGGGWTGGSRASMASLGRWLAERGLAAFAIDYRLAPAHRYPAAIEDAQAAVRWIRTHAAAYRVDPSRLAAFGLSAGGHIAAMLGVLGDGPLDSGARVRVGVAWSAPLDLTRLAADSAPAARAGARRLVESFLGCGGCEERLRDASPATHVDTTDAALFLVNSTNEAQPLVQAERLVSLLEARGVPAWLLRVPGSGHGGAYGGAIAEQGVSVLESSLRYVGIWLDQPRPDALSQPAASRPAAANAAVPVAVLAALGLLAALLLRGARERPARFDPALLARVENLSIVGFTASEIGGVVRPLGGRSPARVTPQS